MRAKNEASLMDCRENCGACCIAPSIHSAIPGMPKGKAAGVLCVQLDKNFACKLFNHPSRPVICRSLMPESTMCGKNRQEALKYLTHLEIITLP